MENIIASQKIPNATLFFGPNLSAQNQAITHYAQQLHNMPNSITTEPSDTIQEPSIDIITINTGTTSIKIDMIKALQQRIKYGPSTHPYAIVIIYNISKLSQSVIIVFRSSEYVCIRHSNGQSMFLSNSPNLAENLFNQLAILVDGNVVVLKFTEIFDGCGFKKIIVLTR